ncbi:MAG: M3 family oligoendopeptidase [Acholeplasmataceae bacterium]|nr:M3 family oligoendopeptidase [Acholeplasmataceae bacterium]
MYEWDLSPLYTGFDSPAFQEDSSRLFVLCEQSLKDFPEKKKMSPVAFLEWLLKSQEEMSNLSSRVFGFISLSISANTQNVQARQAMVKMQSLAPKFTLLGKKFQDYLKDIADLDAVIDQSAFLKEYRFIIHEAKEEVVHSMSVEEEVLTSELVQNGSSLWSQMRRQLTSMAEIEFRGKMLSLTEIRNLAYSNDSEERKEAYQKELEIYRKIEEPMSFAISGIKGQVNTLSRYRHFDDPLAEALFNSRLKKETLDALLAAMKDYLPVFRKYLKHKGQILGHNKGLPWYDLFAPMGRSDKKYTVEEAQAFILKQFGTFGEELRATAEKAFKQNWIDYLPRKAKVGGAFCSNNRAIRESRILSNFGGEIGDVITLAHELGHAYHGEQIFKEAPLNSNYTMPVAETASTLCETIVKKAAYKEAASKEEKVHILEQELQDVTQVIVDIYSRFLFESSVFKAREKSIPSATDLNNLMLDAQKEAYGDGLDNEYLNPGMWINKSHYYSGGLSFYNFPYAFGLLFAKGIYAKYLAEGKGFVEKINQVLRSTVKMNVEDVAATIGIDITQKAFWEEGLRTIVADIEEFINLTNA